jgi:hypothetical protein
MPRDDERLDKLLRAQTAAADAVRAAADVIGVELAGEDANHMGMKRAGETIVRNAARKLRESAAILKAAADMLEGMEPIQLLKQTDD